MANKAKAQKTAKIAAAKSAAPKKAAAANGEAKRGRAPVNSTIKLVKKPAEGDLRGQALAITEILAENGKAGMAKADLIVAIGKKIPSKNVLGASDIWAMNRKKLIDGGFVTEVAA